jgi:hypothetical protein
MDRSSDIESLTQYITDEIFRLFKLSRDSWERRVFGPFFRLPAYRFAKVGVTFDQYIADYGFREAARRILPVFARGVEADNTENIPREGPLLVISNHPGTCDSIAITSTIPRQDLKIVASGIPFVRGLQNAANHLIYTTVDVHERMMVVRLAIRYLKEGGSLLIFPSGRIDPDPALMPTAADELGKWSPSIEVILRHVPQTRVLLTVVSGVLSAGWRWNPFVRLMGDDHKQRSVAEFLQVIQQMIFPNSISVHPRLSYSNPLTTSDLTSKGQELLDGMIEQTRYLMENHIANRKKILPVNA